MKILGVVTLVSPDGEYGGPVRVATNQLAALRERGHTVALAGGHRGFGEQVPDSVEGVPARLFAARSLVPRTGFAGLGSPGLWRAVVQHAREFDVVHIHLARDLVTLPVARLVQVLGVPTVVQTHGMIDETSRFLAKPIDAVLTRRVLKRARRVAYLTPEERQSLQVVSRGRATLVELANGVPVAGTGPTTAHRSPHVLYLARLAPRKRPRIFVDIAASLAAEFPEAQFTLVGPDEGEGGAVESAIASSGAAERIRWIGPVAPERTLDTMRDATVYVLPSVDEPYPMSVLEAMSIGLPVIVTDTCGLAPFIAEHDAGLVVDASHSSLQSALRRMLQDPQAAFIQGERGRAAVRTHRSMDAIASSLEEIYVSAISPAP